MHMNHAFEKVDSVIRDAIGQINHVHISEAELAPSPVDQAQAARVMKELSRDHYSGWVSIEMKAVDDNLQALRGGVSRLVGAFKESVG
jgi:sugar phosphate isomerase/epimerase